MWRRITEYLLAAAADFLAPDTCHLCGCLHDDTLLQRFPLGTRASELVAPMIARVGGLELPSHPVCACCAGGLQEAPGPGGLGQNLAVVAPFYTDEALLRVIHAVKFSRYRSLAAVAAAALACAVEENPGIVGQRPVLVPVPMDRRSFRRRGFNQSDDIACALGRRLGIEVAGELLVKVRRTPPQSLTEPGARVGNVQGAFAPGPDPPRRADVLIVDDIVTTGATVRECARTLAGSGALSVAVLCVGRSRRTNAPRVPCPTALP